MLREFGTLKLAEEQKLFKWFSMKTKSTKEYIADECYESYASHILNPKILKCLERRQSLVSRYNAFGFFIRHAQGSGIIGGVLHYADNTQNKLIALELQPVMCNEKLFKELFKIEPTQYFEKIKIR